MNIGVAYEDGQIAKNLGGCRTFLVVTTEGQNPTGKHLAETEDDNTTALLKLASMEKLDVLICGALGLAIRNALEMIGVLLVPGCEGSAEEAVAKFLVGEKQGSRSTLSCPMRTTRSSTAARSLRRRSSSSGRTWFGTTWTSCSSICRPARATCR